MRDLKTIVKEIGTTAIRFDGFKYINAEIIIEAIEHIIERKTYNCSYTDSLVDTLTDLEGIIEILKENL